ncbi:hypothetical protein DRN86_04800 [Candidatus Geothermarchaeota archaeon]|nr:MAG: hypothetical protein DRN86_04800 [Candidatus Geothermarchaeota archaeon]
MVREMGWGWGRGRGWLGPWPGRGPFSYLPPWQRPGWLFGRGACWWLFGAPWLYTWYRFPYAYFAPYPYSFAFTPYYYPYYPYPWW